MSKNPVKIIWRDEKSGLSADEFFLTTVPSLFSIAFGLSSQTKFKDLKISNQVEKGKKIKKKNNQEKYK